MSRKNSIYKKIPLKKKKYKRRNQKGKKNHQVSKVQRRYVDPCPSGNRGSQVEIHGARKSGGPALIWIGHARTLIFQPSVKSKTGWLSQDSSKAQFRRVSSFSPSTTCPFPFRLIHYRPAFAPLRVFPATRETKTRESRPWAFCPDNYKQLGHRCRLFWYSSLGWRRDILSSEEKSKRLIFGILIGWRKRINNTFLSLLFVA